MAILDLKTALARLPDGEYSDRIRRLAADADDDVADTGFRILRYVAAIPDLELYHHDALIALLAAECSSMRVCDYARHLGHVPTEDQIDTLVSVLERPGSGYEDPSKCLATPIQLGESLKSVLSQEHHERLLGIILREGESMDAESYASRHPDVMTEDLHSKVVSLFRRDTYHGPGCAARYVLGKRLNDVQQSYLIGAIIVGVRRRHTIYHLREFLHNVRGLNAHFVDSILNAMDEHGASASDYRFVAECGTDLTARQITRIRSTIEMRERNPAPSVAHEPWFDPDAVIV